MQRGVQRADQSRRDCRTALLALLTTSTLASLGCFAKLSMSSPLAICNYLRGAHLASEQTSIKPRLLQAQSTSTSSSSFILTEHCTPTTRGQAHAKHLSCEIHLFLLAECPSGHNFDKSYVHVRPNADPHADKNVSSARKTSRGTRAARSFALPTRRWC